ncbi:hypothetical protein [Microbulbifer agarilyticus]
MAVLQGFPGAPSQLSSAVRKALFTSAAATAIAVGTPGYAAAAEIACVPADLGTPMAGDSVTCTGVFDETVSYDVADMTVVDEVTMEETVDEEGNPIVIPGDITVVISEGSTATRVGVSSTTAAGNNAEAVGSVVIENDAAITMVSGGELEVDPSMVVSVQDHGIRIWRRDERFNSGHWWGSSVALDENGEPVGEVTQFDRQITNQEFTEYLAIDPSSADFGNRDNATPGPLEELTFIHAREGSFENGAFGALSAETEAGDISIKNTGDITVGSGGTVTYYSDYSFINTTDSFTDIDTNGDGIDDTRVYGGRDQVNLNPDDIHTATLYVAGITASSISGDITVESEGAIVAGDVSKGIAVNTVDGDIDINNSGDISTGANSVGIDASSATVTETAHSYDYGNGEVYAVEYNSQAFRPRWPFIGPSYSHFVREYEVNANVVDTTDSVIVVENTGDISVGEASIGIKAENPSGDEIVIENSGDITVADGVGGAGIYATTSGHLQTTKEIVREPGAPCNFFFGCQRDYYYVAEGEANESNVENGLVSRAEAQGEVAEGDGTIAFNSSEQPFVAQPGINQTGVYYTHQSPITNFIGAPSGYYTEVQTKHFRQYVQWEANGFFDDEGDIIITNSGNIDIAGVTSGSGIRAVGLGSKSVENSGAIEVGALSSGIEILGAGQNAVNNSGDINLHGAGAAGILINSFPVGDQVELTGYAYDSETADMFGGFNNGDINISNSGDILSLTNTGDFREYNENGATTSQARRSYGITVDALGSNIMGSDVKWVQYGQEVVDHINAGNLARAEEHAELVAAGEMEAEDAWIYNKIEARDGIELHSIQIENSGDIALSDFARGIDVSARYGNVIVENNGTVSIGSGHHGMAPGTYGFFTNASSAIRVDNWGMEGFANHHVVNNGQVITGDVAQGIASYSWHGDSIVVNNGDISVGSGHIIETEFRDTDHGANASGMVSVVAGGFDAYALAENNGNIATGDRSYGMVASNVFTNGVLLTPEFGHNYTVAAINNGMIETGDHSTGIGLNGYLGFAYNAGSISIGSGSMQNNNAVEVGAAMRSLTSDGAMHLMVNAGDISGGDEVAGIYVTSAVAYGVQTEAGAVVVGDDAAGIAATGFNASAQNNGMITTGDRSSGLVSRGTFYSTAFNAGDISVGDDSIGVEAFGTMARVINQGSISAGDDSTAVRLSSAIINLVDESGEVAGERVGYVMNEGSIIAGENGIAIESTEDYAAMVINNGLIAGSMVMGDGDDLIYNAVKTDENGNAIAAGRIVLTDDTIDMGEGVNTFNNVFGDIVFSGDNVIDLGAEGVMTNYSVQDSYVTISSMDGDTHDRLTINGDVNFTSVQGKNGLFLLDLSSRGADRITINGDLTAQDQITAQGDMAPSTLGVALNVIEQGKGERTQNIIDVNGESDVQNIVVTSLSGDFADTILDAEMQLDDNGNWVLTYNAGLSNLGTAAASVSHLAEGFWMRSASVFQSSERSANASENGRVAGMQMWSTSFHTDSDVDSEGDVAGQNLGFTQLVSGHTVGATYAAKLGSSWFTVSPMVGLGSADGSQRDQQSAAALDTESFGISSSLSVADFYVSALYQNVEFDAGVRSYDSHGMTSGTARGYSFEAGWNYLTESGLALTPFAQWNGVQVKMDEFTSSDGNYDYVYELGMSKRASVGVNLSKSFKMSDGFVAPYATFSATDADNASIHDLKSNGVRFNSSASGSGLSIDFGVNGLYKEWIVKGGLGVHSGDVDKNGISAQFSVSRSL